MKKQQPTTKQFQRYGIRKFSQGVASVMIASGMFFLGGGAVAANEVAANTPAEDTVQEKTEEQTEGKTESVEVTAEQSVDTKALTELVAKVQKNFDEKKYEATTETGKALADNLEVAKRTLADSKATQLEVNNTVKALEEAEKAAQAEVNAKIVSEAVEKVSEVTESTTASADSKTNLNNLLAEAPLVTDEVEKYAASVSDESVKKTLTDAVATVNTQVEAANTVMKNDKATAEEVTVAEKNLRDAVKAAADAAVAAGRGEEFEAVLASTAAASDGTLEVGTVSVTDVADRMTNSVHTYGTNSNGSFEINGKTYRFYRVNSASSASTTMEEALALTYTNRSSEGNVGPGILLYGQAYGGEGRDDYPVTKEQFDKIKEEAKLWGNKETASGWKTSNTSTSNGSTYEYLATEIYGYAYEQGQDIVITNFSKRFDLTQEAKNAGWKVIGVMPTNFPNGLYYDTATDTVYGKINHNLENGVYDNRVVVFVSNGSETYSYYLASYITGWIGWKDTTAPTVTTTDDITTAGGNLTTNIRFHDDSSSATATAANRGGNTGSTTANGNVVQGREGQISTAETQVLGVDQIDGITYGPTTGNLTGTASTAGIYTVTAVTKDFADDAGQEWRQSGQEAHESFTITVRPEVKIGNVVTGATEVPVTVSKGATQITVTLPDGTTVEAAKDSNDQWIITGGTSSTATVGKNIGAGTEIKTPVNATSTTVGVDNITAVVSAENVSATLLVNNINLTTKSGEQVVASFDKASGRWLVNSVDGNTVTTVDSGDKTDNITNQWVLVKEGNKGRVTFRTNNSDGTYVIRHMEIITDLSATNSRGGSTGVNGYRVFEFTQTFDAQGTVTAVDTARSDAQTVNTAVIIKYDATTKQWTASDNSVVTAVANVKQYSTTEAASDAWGHGEDGKDYTAIRSASEMKLAKDGAGESVPVYRDTESWTITTSSGVTGIVNRVSNKARDYASVTNTLPTAKGTDYETSLNSEVNLLDSTKVTTSDTEDKTPVVTKVTVTAPDGTVTTYEPTKELDVWNQTKAEVLTAQDAYKQATTDLNDAVAAKLQAEKEATDKNAELAKAEGVLDAAQSELNIAQSMVDNGNLTGEAKTAAEARLEAAKTAIATAQANVTTLTSELRTLHGNVAKAMETVNDKLATVNTTRATLEEKEDELASSKNAVAAAVENALKDSRTFKLTKVGQYKVSLSVIDSASNQVLTDATAGGTADGTDTNSGVLEATDVTANYTITVKQGIEGTPKTSTDIQGAVQTGQPTFTFDDADKTAINQGTKVYTLTSTEAKDADGKVVGTYSIDATTGVVTFTPNKDFVGTPTPAEVTLTVTVDGIDPISATATYTPTVVPVKPVAAPSKTEGPQGVAQTSPITYNADNNNDNTDSTLNFSKGSTEVNGEMKSVELDKKSVKLIDPSKTGKDAEVETLTVANQGTYTLEKDGEGNVTGVKFTPLVTFTGEATPVTVRIADANGTTAETTYTPKVTPVEAKAEPATSTGTQGSTQSGTPTYTAPTVDNSLTVTPKYELEGADQDGKVTVPNVGTYTIDNDGKVTFVPVASYTGTPEGVKVKVTYSISSGVEGETPATVTAETTYTPTVTPVTAEGTPKTSTDIQGAVQNGTPEFKVSDETNIVKGDDNKPKATYSLEGANAAGEVTVENEGTYTINPTTGEVTFTPVATFTGEATGVTVKATYTLETADAQDNTTSEVTATAKYVPTVIPVAPTASESSTTGIQGATQKSEIVLDSQDENVNTVNFNKGTEKVNNEDKSVALDPSTVTLLDASGKPATSVTVEGQGTYTIVEEDGKKLIQFVPVKSYVGDVTPVTVQIADANGTTVTTTYKPKIVGVEPIADASRTTGKQGKKQTTPIVYDAENNSDGDVTTLNFAGGSATVNGKKETAALDQKSVTLLDAQGNAVDTLTVDGEGTYTLVKDAEGKVTAIDFQPETDFTGTAKPVNVRVTDENGKQATTTYTPTVIPNGSLVVNYVDEDGKVIQDPYISGKVLEDGSEYDTTTSDLRPEKITDKDGNVYFYKKLDENKSAAAKGKIVGGNTTEVTYVYEKAGSVVVNYTLADGTVIKDPVTPEAYNGVKGGTDYNTDTETLKPQTITTADGKTYRIVPSQTKGNESGKVVAGEKTQVTYIYEEVKGNVVVENYDTNGNKLGETTEVVKSSSTGTDYKTSPETKVEVNGKTYYYKQVKEDSAPEEGKVKEGTTTVKYVYEEAGSVKVNYTLADGTVIKTPVTPENYKDAKAGTAYTTSTEELKPETITTADGKTYRLVPSQTKGNESGSIESGKTAEVTYIYEEVKGNVVVENYDTNGNKLGETTEVVKSSSTGTDYKTTPETKVEVNGKTYYYKQVKEDSAPESGKVKEGTTTVKYVYEEAGSVKVNYTLADGTVIKESVTPADYKDAKAGTAYTTSTEELKPETITTADGKTYRLVPSQTKGNESGKVIAGEKAQVTYIYEEVKGNVVVENYDTKGNKLGETTEVVKPSSTGTDYKTTPETKVEVNGKTYYYKEVKSDSAPEEGKVKEGTTTVKYVYEEAGSVKVNYTLADGTVIKDPVTPEAYKDAKAGTDYTTNTDVLKPQTITTADGKTYRLVPSQTKGNESGSIESGVTAEVTYIYEEVKGNVVVENYDTKGNKIGETTEVVKPSSTGTDYKTTPETKVEVNGKTYYYKEVKSDSAPEEGKVKEGTTTVKYVYEEAGSVKVNYTLADGTVIKDPVTPEAYKDAKAGTDYTTNTDVLKPQTITTADGKTYRLVPSQTKGNESGSIESGVTAEVTYIYEEVVKTSFVDKNGNPIPGNPTEEGELPKRDIPGYRFVETKKLPNGDTEHVYEKVTTSYVTTDGKAIPGYPTVEGEQPKKDIPGYEFVETKVDADGNTIHIYRQLTPEQPATPADNPAELPNTGMTGDATIFGAAAAAILSGLGIALPGKKKED